VRGGLDKKIEQTKSELKQDIANLRTELKQDNANLDNKISETKADLMKWMFIFIFGQYWLIVGTLTAILFAFFKR